MALSLRHHQRYIWKCPERTLELKSRQVGLSTENEADLYVRAKDDGANCAVIAHDLATSKKIFEMFGRYHDYDSLDKPRLKRGNVGEMIFADREGAIEVSTAGSPNALRGRTPQAIHGSEVAWWGEHGPAVDTAVKQAVPKRLGTSIVYETTANGEDPLFFPMWQNAATYCHLRFEEDPDAPFGFHIERTIDDPDGQWNQFHPLFVSALDDEDCRMDLEADEAERFAQLDEEEQWLVDMHSAPLEFLKWRRSVLASECRGDLNILHQEYPVTADQAFVGSGNPRYRHDILSRMKIEPGRRGYLVRDTRWEARVFFREEKTGDLLLFRPPVPWHRYVVSVDTSQGIQTEASGRCPLCKGKSDESSVQVLDIDCGGQAEQVALLHGRIDEEELIDPVLTLCRWYNLAYLVVEHTGGYGEHLIQEVMKEYPMDRIFHGQDWRGNSSRGRGKPGLGIHVANRSRLLTDLASLLHGMHLDLHAERTVHQLRQIKRMQGGRYEAAPGHHDDDVFSLIGAMVGWKFYPDHLEPGNLAPKRSPFDHQPQAHRFGAGPVNPDPEGYY